MTFSDFNLRPEILAAIEDLGFSEPMPVQAKVLPILLTTETDMVALAQTGTGKTAAFGLPLIEKCKPKDKTVEALVLSPTRELCMQIAKDLKNFSKNIPDLRICAVYGGASIERQLDEIARGVKIVVATPGRMLDILRRGKIDFSHLHTVVFDEADEMLNMGFRDELDGILENTPEDKHTWLFSATMPKEIRQIANHYMHDPQEVTIGTKNEGSANVTHHYYMVNSKDRYLALKRIIDFYPDIYSIIFCRTRRETQEVAEQLIKDGYNADALHGDLSQAQRDNAMSRFRLKNLQLLVATDVAARGLDVNNLTHVLNYNLPDEIEQYIHRSGRTGRASATGISIAIITPREKSRLRAIEKVLKKEFILQHIPQGEEICEKQLLYQVNKMMQLDMGEGAGPIDKYLPAIYERLEDLSKEEIIKRFVWREFNRFSEYYANAPIVQDMGDVRQKAKSDTKRGQKGVEEGLTRIFVNLGHMDGIKPQSMMGIINDTVGSKDARIGRIEIYKTCSFVEIDERYQQEVLDGLNHTVWGDRKLYAESAKGEEKAKGKRTSERMAAQEESLDKQGSERRSSSRKKDSGRHRDDWDGFDYEDSPRSASRKRASEEDFYSEKPERSERASRKPGRKDSASAKDSRSRASKRKREDVWDDFYQDDYRRGSRGGRQEWMDLDSLGFDQEGYEKPKKSKRKKQESDQGSYKESRRSSQRASRGGYDFSAFETDTYGNTRKKQNKRSASPKKSKKDKGGKRKKK